MRIRQILAGGLLSMAVMGCATAHGDELVSVRQFQAVADDVPPIGYLTGVATNVSDKPLKAVFLNFNLYDDNQVLVGNAIASAQNLSPGQDWRFRAPTAVLFAKATLVKIDAY